MKNKLFTVLIVLSFALPFNAMAIEASYRRLMIQEVYALNDRKEFRLKMVDLLDPRLKNKISDMRQKYNLQYTGILKKNGFAVNGIDEELDAIWQQAVSGLAEKTIYLLVLISPSIIHAMAWEEYKSRVLGFTEPGFNNFVHAYVSNPKLRNQCVY